MNECFKKDGICIYIRDNINEAFLEILVKIAVNFMHALGLPDRPCVNKYTVHGMTSSSWGHILVADDVFWMKFGKFFHEIKQKRGKFLVIFKI